MSSRVIRVALCQIECHPAIYSGHIAYPEEPFVPGPNSGSLSRLGTKGIDVGTLQTLCRVEYAAWQQARIQQIIDYLRSLHPAPDIVLFPEGALSPECLPAISAWSGESGATVLGGTHTPITTPSGLRHYSNIGVSAKERKRAARAPSVLPLFRNGKVVLISKQLSSPFERSDITATDPDVPKYKTYPIQTGNGKFHLLSLICIEALQLQQVEGAYEIVGVISYDARPEQFESFIDQQVRNRHVVLYCNDGHFGQSRLGVVHDNRMPSWLLDAMPRGLPSGDAILVVDVDLSVKAIEVGTAQPSSAARIVKLSSITYEHSEAALISQQLDVIHKLPSGSARAQALAQLLQNGFSNPLQQLRISHLRDIESRGTESTDWWNTIGSDCLVHGQADYPRLEGRLAAACRDELRKLLSAEAVRRDDVAQMFLSFYSECETRASRVDVPAPPTPSTESITVVDREAEARVVADFLDDRSATVLEVSGLPQIGKTSVIEKALAQAGVAPILRITLTATSSPDYLLYTLLQRGPGLPLPPYQNPVEVARSASISTALRALRVIVIERAHFLLELGTWRDDNLGNVLTALIATAGEVNTKLVLETQRALPLDLENPGVRRLLRVSGFNKTLRIHGEALFDAQLRRVGLSPDVIQDVDRGAIVERLGGHPVAIALAADAYFEVGGDGVLNDLKQRRGFYLTFLQRLLRSLNLTDEDETILRMLALSRVPLDRSVIFAAVTFPAAPIVRNLVALGTVDFSPDGRIEIAGVLREYFDPQELSPEARLAFHRAAAKAFEGRALRSKNDIEAAVEAEYHAGIAGVQVSIPSRLIDGALATAQEHFRSQNFDAAAAILEVLLRKDRSLTVLRLAAQVEARRNRAAVSLELAKEVLLRDPKDTRLLADLAKIALWQRQDDTTATQLIDIARRVGVEDVSILVVEGRMHLRRNRLHDAVRVFERAKQLTRWNTWPFFYLGVCYQRLGRVNDAINILEEGVEFFYTLEARSRSVLNAMRTQLGLAYLFNDDLEMAGRILDPLFEEEPSSPEVVRAYAALTIKRDGIQQARKAFERLHEAHIRNRFDRCEFHLLYGLFQLGIGNQYEAAQEFAKAHAADRSNVYVMMKWARTLYELATALRLDGNEVYKIYALDCSRLVQKILEFDPDNEEGVALMNGLHQVFGVDLDDSKIAVS